MNKTYTITINPRRLLGQLYYSAVFIAVIYFTFSSAINSARY